MNRRFSKSYREMNSIQGIVVFIPVVLLLLLLFSFRLSEKGKPFHNDRLLVNLPMGTLQEGISKDKPILYLTIGRSKFRGCNRYGSPGPMLSINDKISRVSDLLLVLSQEPYYSAFQSEIKVVIRADKETPMSEIDDIKSLFRRLNYVEILYAQQYGEIDFSKEKVPPNLWMPSPRLPPFEKYPNFFKKK